MYLQRKPIFILKSCLSQHTAWSSIIAPHETPTTTSRPLQRSAGNPLWLLFVNRLSHTAIVIRQLDVLMLELTPGTGWCTGDCSGTSGAARCRTVAGETWRMASSQWARSRCRCHHVEFQSCGRNTTQINSTTDLGIVNRLSHTAILIRQSLTVSVIEC